MMQLRNIDQTTKGDDNANESFDCKLACKWHCDYGIGGMLCTATSRTPNSQYRANRYAHAASDEGCLHRSL
jgi:hypothetical protein